MSAQPIKLPVDLTPAQRARLKLYWHFAVIAVFNGVLVAFALLSNGKAVTWQDVLDASVAQAALALLDALKKYYTASGQPALSTFFDLVRTEAASKAPAVTLSENEQALQQTVNGLFAVQTDASPNAATSSGAANQPTIIMTTSDLKAAVAGAPPATSSAPADQGSNYLTASAGQPTMSNGISVNTLPNIATVAASIQASAQQTS